MRRLQLSGRIRIRWIDGNQRDITDRTLANVHSIYPEIKFLRDNGKEAIVVKTYM